MHLGRLNVAPACIIATDCRSISLNAPEMANAPLIPVPATRHTTVRYRAGSVGVKYGPSRRSETGTGFLAATEALNSGWEGPSNLNWVVEASSACATSASRSVHCAKVFWPRSLLMRAKNDGAKPSAAVHSAEAVGFPRDLNKNWMSMSSSD